VGQSIVAGAGTGAIYAVFAVGLVLVFRTTGALNFAQAEIGTFGAFVAWWIVVEQDGPWLVGAAAGLLASVALGLALERMIFRPLMTAPRSTLVVATVTVALGIGAAELKLFGASPALLPAPIGGSGITVANVNLAPTRLLAIGAAIVLSAAAWAFFRATTFGIALLGMAQNPVAIRLAGIRLKHLSAFTWGASAALGAVAAILTAPTLGAFSAFFLGRVLVFGFAAAVIGGGLTSFPGAIAGGIALGVWEGVITDQFPSTPGLVDATVFVLLAAVLLDRARRPRLAAA
jgi:branched-chain amino acid transport system permease protein